MKALKVGLLGLGALVLVAVALAVYLLATFDARDYAPRIAELVKEKTGRTLRIGGDFKLSFWPDVGVRLGGVSLSERDSDGKFAEAESVRFMVRLRPLFSRKLVAEDLLVQGANVRITRFADGRLNIDDLMRSDGPTPSFDIARVRVERSGVSYLDLATNKRYEITGIELETGRVSNAAVTPLKLAFAGRDDARTFDLSGALQARLTLDLAQQHYALDDAVLDLKGTARGLDGASTQLKGNVAARVKPGEVDAMKLTGTLKVGTAGEQQVQAEVHVLKLALKGGSIVAESVSGAVNAAGPTGNTRVTISSPMLVQSKDRVIADTTTLTVEAIRGEHTLEASGTTMAELQTAERTLALTKLEANVAIRSASLPAKGITGALNGGVKLDFAGDALQATLAGTLGGSRVKAKLAATGLAAPVYRLVGDVDQLDLDRYSARSDARTASGTGFDLSTLSGLPATGTLHIGTLTTGGLKARNVNLAVKP